jgi:hypothetical protein
MRREIDVVFSGAVFSVRVFVGSHQIPIARNFGEDKWSGSDELDITGDSVQIDMRMTAPSFTGWELVVKFDGKEALKESGISQAPKFAFSKRVPLVDGLLDLEL